MNVYTPVKLTEKTANWIKKYADDNDKTPSEVIREAIVLYIKQKQKDTQAAA